MIQPGTASKLPFPLPSSLPQHRRPGHGAPRPDHRFPFRSILFIIIITVVAVPPAFFSTIAAILQAAHLSQIITGAIEEASALAHLKPQPSSSSSTFASVAGPVIKRNFPDPSAIKVGHVWHAFATNNANGGPHVQVAVSNDFESWTYLEKDALPTVGPWSNGVGIWAPDVVQLVRVSLIYTTPGRHHVPRADLDPI